jgi:two-component system cell cycle response regulator
MKRSRTILIVDDEALNLEKLAMILDADSYHLRVAYSGEQALQILRRFDDIDLILLDILMPHMSGYEVATRIKEQATYADIPIIFLTANSSVENIVEGFKHGAVDYIAKPFASEELLARIDTHLRLKELQDSLEVALKVSKENLEALNATQKELARFVDILDHYVISSTMDLEGNIVDISEAFCNISGYSKEDLLGEHCTLVNDSKRSAERFKEVWSALASHHQWSGEIKNRKKDGTPYWTKSTIVPNVDPLGGKKLGYTAIFEDITDKKRIEELAILDELTGLYNRRHFNDMMEAEISRTQRDGKLLSLMMLDLDHFKRYNDTYGHQEGDKVLIQLGLLLGQYTDVQSDYAFRLGGEEFALLFRVDAVEKALMLAEGLIAYVEELKMPHINNTPLGVVTISAGVLCVVPSKEENATTIYKRVDDLLYQAKAKGRNCVVANDDSYDLSLLPMECRL